MMKRIMKTALSLSLALSVLCVSVTVFYAETIFASGDYLYTLLEENFVSIYSWDGGTDTLTIPATLDHYRVKEIRNGCFNGRSDFTSVSFVRADNLNRIGYNAFKNSAISGTVNIPPQVNTVGASAFQNCDGIQTLYYNAMSNVISTQCFYDCDSLSIVYIADSVTTIESHAFSSCDSLKVVRVPAKVTSIAATAFDGDLNLVIYCYTDSAAHQFAESNGIEYVLIDAPEPTEPAPTEPTPTEPVPTEPVPTEKIGYLLGDVDNNGVVDTIDASWIQRYVAFMSVPMSDETMMQGDVDGDGYVSAIDATIICRYVAQIEIKYPVGEMITP